eukprot:COSAG01_NODE_12066_length_1805_cov_2.876905_2_plen_154_part_00
MLFTGGIGCGHGETLALLFLMLVASCWVRVLIWLSDLLRQPDMDELVKNIGGFVTKMAVGKMAQVTAVLGTTIGSVIDCIAELYDKAVSSGAVDGDGNLNEDGVIALKEDVRATVRVFACVRACEMRTKPRVSLRWWYRCIRKSWRRMQRWKQ